jgi:hypothetical protein
MSASTNPKVAEAIDMTRQVKRSGWLLGAILLGLLALLCVTAWFYFNRLALSSTEAGYRNVTMTDALLRCQNHIQQRHQNRLVQLVYDQRSSHWHHPSTQYRLFFDAALLQSPNGSTNSLHIQCFIDGKSGAVADYTDISQASPTAAPAGGGSLFGWP